MNLYISKLNGMGGTIQYVQCMAAEIAHELGFREMGVYRYNANAEAPGARTVRFDGMIAGIQAGDIVVCQFHTWNGLRFERGLVEHIKAYHGRIVIFIHSLEALMIKSSRFMLGGTIELYNQAEALIVPSQEMKKFLVDSGIRKSMKFIIQEMWDCRTEIDFQGIPAFRKEIHYPGAAPEFVQKWNYELPLNQDIGLRPEELLLELSRGGFGLEWYHDEQAYQYMRYGNSFSLSRYLAAGIPVIVPSGISCQRLIEENYLGLVADSLDEAVSAVEAMDESEYQEYVRHVKQFAPSLRKGYYTKKCLIESVWMLFREDAGKASMYGSEVYGLGDFRFVSVSLKKSYGGNLALSWNLKGRPDGFLIYDASGRLLEETENSYQHYLLLKGYGAEEVFIVKAYVNTQKGKLVVAVSMPIRLSQGKYREALVSVVIPAYNAQRDIVRSIDTVLAQSLADLEIVVVDDGSTDSTPDILDWYKENYENIKVIHQQNVGVQATRNTGVLHTNGKYIGFVDSDDMIRPDMMERLYTCIKRNQCDIAVTSAYEINYRGYSPIMQHSIEENKAVAVEEYLQMYASGGYAMPAIWNKLYRASLVKEHLLPLIRYEDEAWTPYVLSYADKICYLDEGGYEYDRSNCSNSLVDQWARKSKEEVFGDHKRSILFYLEQGNPKRLGELKELAKSELTSFAKVFAYDGYKELREEVERIKQNN